jgi:hypothetical protein
MTQIVRASSTARISFTTVAGQNYAIEYKNKLTDPIWMPLTTMAGTGGVLTVEDAQATEASRFYRIRVEFLIAPRITQILHAGANTQISFTTVAGQNYTVERKNALTDSIWSPLATVAGTGTVLIVQDAQATEPMRFYRIRVE